MNVWIVPNDDCRHSNEKYQVADQHFCQKVFWSFDQFRQCEVGQGVEDQGKGEGHGNGAGFVEVGLDLDAVDLLSPDLPIDVELHRQVRNYERSVK